MGLIEEIAERVGVGVAKHGSLVLVASDDAAVLLDGCESEGLRVLGIEGFLMRGTSVVPDMDAIADFSGMETASASVLEARRFVESTSSRGLMLDFSVERGGS